MREHLITSDGLRWNVQEAGQGETILLIHGTGASVHSWRDVMPLLATDYHVLAIDLPGHGKTLATDSRDYSLERMGRGLFAVLDALKLSPHIMVGHSAGAAIIAWMCAQNKFSGSFVSFNGAFYPIAGAFAALFSPVAKLMAFNPLLPRIMSGMATRETVVKLLRDTGSDISPEGVDLYLALFKDPKHIAGALGMMAAWDLSQCEVWLSRMSCSATFVSGSRDRSVPPETANRAAAKVRKAHVLRIEGFGHLLHEEAPDKAADIIRGAGAST